jgi:hypothetical protein
VTHPQRNSATCLQTFSKANVEVLQGLCLNQHEVAKPWLTLVQKLVYNSHLVVGAALERARLTGRPLRQQCTFAIGSPGLCNLFAKVSKCLCRACRIILQHICNDFAMISPGFRKALANARASTARAHSRYSAIRWQDSVSVLPGLCNLFASVL